MRSLLPITAIVLALTSWGAAADGCVPTTSVTSAEQVVVELPRNGLVADYLVSDLCQPECVFSVWPYFERNGIEGLQRGDEARDDTCGGLIDPDSWYHI